MLEVVVLARLLQEHVHDEVAVVHQDPGGVGQPLHPDGRELVGLLDAALDLFDQRAHVPAVRCAGDHEGVDHAEELGHGQHDRVLPELGIGRLGRRGRSRQGELNVDAEPWAQWSTSKTPTVRANEQHEDGHSDDRPATTGSRRAGLLGPPLGPQLRAGADGRTAAGRGDSSVVSAGRALICRQRTDCGGECNALPRRAPIRRRDRPRSSTSRTAELDTSTSGPSTHSTRQPGGRCGVAPSARAGRRAGGRETTARVTMPPDRPPAPMCPGQRSSRPRSPDRSPAAAARPPAASARSCLDRRHRVARPTPVDLHAAGLDAGDPLRQGLGHGEPVLGGRHGPARRLLPGVVGHDQQQAVERQGLRDGPRAATCPMCGGSNVPPKRPIRSDGRLALRGGKLGRSRRRRRQRVIGRPAASGPSPGADRARSPLQRGMRHRRRGGVNPEVAIDGDPTALTWCDGEPAEHLFVERGVVAEVRRRRSSRSGPTPRRSRRPRRSCPPCPRWFSPVRPGA